MRRTMFFALPLAAMIMIQPAMAAAKRAVTPVSFRLPSAHADPSPDPQMRKPFLARIANDPRDGDAVARLPEPPFRARLLASGRQPKIQSFALNWDSGGVVLDTLRTKSVPRTEGPGLAYNRFSAARLDAGLVQSLGQDDSFALSASYGLERRRPSLFVGAHNIYRTENRSITASWTHDDRLHISLSAFATRPSRIRNDVERLVELAGGAAPAVRGLSISAIANPDGDAGHLSYGVEVRRQSYIDGDAGRIGVLPGRNDARIAFVLRRGF